MILSTDGGVHVLRVDHVLLLVECDVDLPPLLDEGLFLGDAHGGDPPVLRGVELCEIIQLVLCLWESQEAAVSLTPCLLQLVHDGSVEALWPLPHNISPGGLPW